MSELVLTVFANPGSTELVQLCFTFATGLAFGASSVDLRLVLALIVIYELAFFVATRGLSVYWRFEFRLALECTYVIGVMLSSWLLKGEDDLRSLFGWPIPMRS